MDLPSATRDGKRVTILRYFHRTTGYLADLEDGTKRLLNIRLFTPDEGGEDTTVDWTPDHKAIILNLNRADHTTFQRQPLNGDANEMIGTVEGLEEFASLSPDGKWIIAQVWSPTWDQGLTLHLVRIPIGGGNPELIFTVPEFTSSFFCARFSSNLCAVGEQTADYKQAIIRSFDPIKGKGPELARFDLGPEYQTKRMELIWGISDDGTKLAFASGPQGPIQVSSLRSGQQQVIRAHALGSIRGIAWAHDGKGFFISSNTKDGNEIIYLNLEGEAKVLWNCGNDHCHGGPSPDGRQFAMDVRKLSSNLWMIENF
jgi:Tol biopolymer transport system component